jgi:hypothetical protein
LLGPISSWRADTYLSRKNSEQKLYMRWIAMPFPSSGNSSYEAGDNSTDNCGLYAWFEFYFFLLKQKYSTILQQLIFGHVVHMTVREKEAFSCIVFLFKFI